MRDAKAPLLRLLNNACTAGSSQKGAKEEITGCAVHTQHIYGTVNRRFGIAACGTFMPQGARTPARHFPSHERVACCVPCCMALM